MVDGATSASCERRLFRFDLEVFLFGTGMMRTPRNVWDLTVPVHDPILSDFNTAKRWSPSTGGHLQCPVFLFVPQCGQRPWQSSLQSAVVGNARTRVSKICGS